MAQGPISIDGCTFQNYSRVADRHMSAIGFSLKNYAHMSVNNNFTDTNDFEDDVRI